MAQPNATSSLDTALTTDMALPKSSSLSPKESDVLSLFLEQASFDSTPSVVEESPETDGSEDTEEQDLLEPSGWELLVSGFMPLLLYILTAAVTLLHSLVWGHGTRWILALMAPVQSRVASWVQEATLGLHAVGLLLPAVAIIFLLLVECFNPNGFHWIIMENLRSTMVSLLQTSSTCWALVLNDYGAIVSTILALSTFASLFLLAYILHKTLTPRQKEKPRPSTDKKKKKRKGNSHARGHRGGGRVTQPLQQNCASATAVASRNISESVVEEERETANTKDCSVVEGNERDNVALSLPALAEDKPLSPRLPRPTPSPERRLVAKALREDSAPSRIRATSSSTVDTTMLSDDISCETESGRSTPIATVVSMTEPVRVGSAIDTSKEDEKTQAWATSSRKNSNRRSKMISKDDTAPKTAPTSSRDDGLVPSTSRWDALKPNSRDTAAGRRFNPKVRPAPPQAKPPLQSRRSPVLEPIGKPMLRSPLLASVESICRSIGDFDLPASLPILTPAADSPSTWYSSQKVDHDMGASTMSSILSPPRGGVAIESMLLSSPLQTDESTTFFSTLDARSPCWSRNGVPASCAVDISALRAPPGLTLDDSERCDQPAFVESPFLPSTFKSLSGKSLSSPLRFGSVDMPAICNPVKENPFASDESDYNNNQNSPADDQIEAELQELGGQMVGSILDF